MRKLLILRIAGAILASTTGVGGLRAHDLLVNGSFTTDLSGWTLPANGATWSNGQLSLYAPAGESRTVAQCVAVSGRGRVQASYRASWFFGFPGHFGYGLSGAVHTFGLALYAQPGCTGPELASADAPFGDFFSMSPRRGSTILAVAPEARSAAVLVTVFGEAVLGGAINFDDFVLDLSAGPTRSDFDNDGLTDLLWRDSNSGVVAVQTSQWTPPEAPSPGAPTFLFGVPAGWEPLVRADVDGDGTADVVWLHRPSGLVAIWFMRSSTVIDRVAFPGTVDAGWSLQAVGDITGDGRADLLWRDGADGHLLGWMLDRNGNLERTRDFGLIPLRYELSGAGDLDGDGIEDLLWYSPSERVAVAWLMSDDETYKARFVGDVTTDGWRPLRIADLDRDGTSDILWRNEISGEVAVWYLAGGAVADVDFLPSAPPARWQLGTIGNAWAINQVVLWWYDATNGGVARWLMRGRHVAPDVAFSVSGPGWGMVP